MVHMTAIETEVQEYTIKEAGKTCSTGIKIILHQPEESVCLQKLYNINQNNLNVKTFERGSIK
jgi:hypothetical protein